MERRRNEGGRFSAQGQTDWYKAIEEAHIRRIEQEWQLKQAVEEYYAQLHDECVADEFAEQYERAAAAAADADAERSYQAWEEEQRHLAELAAADLDAERYADAA